MNLKFHQFVVAIMSVWLLGANSPASANKPANITGAEWALLPPYCADTQGFKYGDAYSNTSPYARKWVALMGKDFWHMHHYCWALINYRRAQRVAVAAPEKTALRREALSDLTYVVENVDRQFVLLPEIYTLIGRTEVLLRRPQEAGAAFASAWTLKPDYWPPYFHWAEFLGSHGKKAEALEVVKAGLQHSPGTQGLLMLFHDLGGKPSDIPPPIAKKEAPTTPDARGNDETESPPAPAAPAPE